MKALVYDWKIKDSMMRWDEHFSVPQEPKRGQVKVKVLYAGLNPFDYKVPSSSALMSLRKNTFVGIEFVGKVVSVGARVQLLREGDIVFGGARSGGSLAEYIIVNDSEIILVPRESCSDDNIKSLGALTIAALTAYQGLHAGRVFSDGSPKRLMVLGASGGVGHLVVQFVKACAPLGSFVVAVCSQKNMDFVRSLGADEILDYTKAGFDIASSVSDIDVVFDAVTDVNFDYEPNARKTLKKSGIYVALNSGRTTDWIRTFAHQATGYNLERKNYRLILCDANKKDLLKVLELFQSGKLKLKIQRIMNFSEEEVTQGYNELKTQRTVGKLIVRVGSE